MAYGLIPLISRTAPFVGRKLIKDGPKLIKKAYDKLTQYNTTPHGIIRIELEAGRQIKEKRKKK